MNLSIVHGNNPLSMMSSMYRHQNQPQNAVDTNLPSSLSIYNSLTGAKLIASSFNFHNLEALKQFISESFKITVENLFLLTPFGIKLKFSMVVHEEINEIYVFDRRFFNVSNLESEDKLMLTNELLDELNQAELINMIKPMSSPIISDELSVFVERLSIILENTRNLKAFDLNLNSLRLLLNSLRRNSGWASALLSDFRKTVAFDETTPSEDDDIEVILTSLNVLIQYVGLVFKNLEKKFNESIDSLILLQTNSMVESWKQHYANLKKISFDFVDPATHTNGKLRMSDMVSENDLESCSNDSRKLNKYLNERLVILRSKIENDIMKPKQSLVKEYDLYTVEFMKSTADRSKKEQIIEDCKSILAELEGHVSKLINSTKSLPSFEDLITTSSQTSTNLSSDSVHNIKKLIELYQTHEKDLVPIITKLADQLYQVQVKKLNMRKELQTRLISSTLVSITKIQLNIMKSSAILNNDISKNLNLLKDSELQLSVVSDLPLIFGIWAIANLNNLKYGLSLNKLVKKSNEIFEMLKFMESKNRSKWLKEFILSSGGDKLDFLKLDEDAKRRFVSDNLLSFKITPVETSDELIREGSASPTFQQQQLLSPTSPSENHYLSPINKLLQNINGFPMHARSTQDSQQRLNNQTVPNQTSLKRKENEANLFNNLSKYVTVNNVLAYIDSLQTVGVDPHIVGKLRECLKDFGIVEDTASRHVGSGDEEGEEIVVRGGDTNGVGSFDSADFSFVKLLKKFLKSFESDGITINISLEQDQSVTHDELVKGYERRIKKLENLLHTQNFQQFNDHWSHHNRGPQQPPAMRSRQPSESTNNDNENAENTVLFDENLGLGRKVVGLPPSHHGERIEKLQKDNANLTKELNEFKSSPAVVELESLKRQLEDSRLENENLKKANEEKDKKISDLETELSCQKTQTENLTQSNKHLETLCNELKSMKSDLLENMSQKENEFTKESKVNQQEINELKLRIEELEEDENNLITVNKSINERIVVKDQLLCQMYELTQKLYQKLNQLSSEIFSNLTRVCLLLESIGLLLIRETPSFDNQPGVLTIKRVKGLRSRKKQIKQTTDSVNNNDSVNDTTVEDIDQIDNALMEVVSSEVVPEAEQYLHWVDMNVLNYTLSSDLGIEEETVAPQKAEDGSVCDLRRCEESSIEKKIKKVLQSYENLNIELGFQNFLKFNHVDNELIVERVFRRFNDVETLARKLQKDKNQQKLEIKSLHSEARGKLSFRNFKTGDLVLFLKTLIPANGGELKEDKETEDQPWAAFNIGSPNYYLKNVKFSGVGSTKNGSKAATDGNNYIDLSNRDWFVGRIMKIDSKLVTDENYNDPAENPFKLTKALSWYFVEAKEEKFGSAE